MHLFLLSSGSSTADDDLSGSDESNFLAVFFFFVKSVNSISLYRTHSLAVSDVSVVLFVWRLPLLGLAPLLDDWWILPIIFCKCHWRFWNRSTFSNRKHDRRTGLLQAVVVQQTADFTTRSRRAEVNKQQREQQLLNILQCIRREVIIVAKLHIHFCYLGYRRESLQMFTFFLCLVAMGHVKKKNFSLKLLN